MLNFQTILSALCNDLSIENSDVSILQCRLANEGPAFLTKTLPLFDRVLLDALEQGVLSKHRVQQSLHVTNFRWKGNFPTLFAGLFSRIFDKMGRVLPNHLIDPYAIYCIRQICGYFYKLALDFDDSLLFEKEKEFVNTDNNLDSEVDFVYVEELRKSLETNYKELTSVSFSDVLHTIPTNAPSGTFSAKSSNRKIEDLMPWYLWKDNIVPPSKLESSFWFAYAKPKVFGVPAYDVTRNLVPYKRRLRKTTDIPLASLDLEEVSELLFVPKDSRGPRTIVREPAHTLPIQMTYFAFLSNYLEYKTRKRVNFSSQTINRDLAKLSSMSKSFSTIDLKDASDRVSFSMVKRLFKNLPSLRKFLDFRTTHCSLPSGKTIKLNKLAGMGSGLTFATMAFIIHHTIAFTFSKLLGISYKKASSYVYVYGDDIMVPSHLHDLAISALNKVGLRVNITKSFSRSHFRESCGGDYYNGNEVSPVRLKLSSGNPIVKSGRYLSYKKGSRDSFLNQLCKHSNELDKAGLLTLSTYYYTRIEQVYGIKLPFSANDKLNILHRRSSKPGISIPRLAKCDKVGNYKPIKAYTYSPVSSSILKKTETVLCEWLRDNPLAPQWWSRLWIFYEDDSQPSTNRVNIPRKGVLREILVSSISLL